MPTQRRLGICPICQESFGLLQGRKCAICGRVVCLKCCIREKGVNAIIQSMNGKPIVLCSSCLSVREASIENRSIVDDSHATEKSTGDEWCEGLLCILF